MGLLLTYTIIYYGCELGVIILYLLIYALEFNFYLVCTWNSQNWLTNTVTMCHQESLGLLVFKKQNHFIFLWKRGVHRLPWLRSSQSGSSECQSNAYTLTNWATGATLEQRIGGNIHGHSLILKLLVVGFTLHANRQLISKCISLPTMYEKVISHWPCEL